MVDLECYILHIGIIFGIIALWDRCASESLNVGLLQFWIVEVLKYGRFEMLLFWNVGDLGWNLGSLWGPDFGLFSGAILGGHVGGPCWVDLL